MFSVIDNISSTMNVIITICLITFITSKLSSWYAITTITSVKNFLTIPLNITVLDSFPLSVLLDFCHIAEIRKPTIKSITIKTINTIKSSVGLPIRLINRLPIVPTTIDTMFFSLMLINLLSFILGLPMWFTALIYYLFHSSVPLIRYQVAVLIRRLHMQPFRLLFIISKTF